MILTLPRRARRSTFGEDECAVVNDPGRRPASKLRSEGLHSVETVVTLRPRHDTASLPLAHDPADVFTRDPGQGRQVALIDLVVDHDAPGFIGFTENLRKLDQGPVPSAP